MLVTAAVNRVSPSSQFRGASDNPIAPFFNPIAPSAFGVIHGGKTYFVSVFWGLYEIFDNVVIGN